MGRVPDHWPGPVTAISSCIGTGTGPFLVAVEATQLVCPRWLSHDSNSWQSQDPVPFGRPIIDVACHMVGKELELFVLDANGQIWHKEQPYLLSNWKLVPGASGKPPTRSRTHTRT